ncbi:MAG: hypothetical protein M1155_00310 [Patescibacteria group bacterium]|nr:hypothetical protein [Patescibacteria group bacterium]
MIGKLSLWERAVRRIKYYLFFWKSVGGVWVFDLDGPLMDTGMFYDRALKEFSERMLSVFNGKFSVKEILDKQHELDLQMMYDINPYTGEYYLLHKSRFPLSLMKTYRFFCEKIGKKFNGEIGKKMRDIGKKVFLKDEYDGVIRSEVLSLFQFLKSKNEKIFILTKGDDEIQGDKKWALKKAGIMAYCDDFYVVPDHKNKKIKEIKSENPALRYYCVGDTYKEDVEIGIRIGFFGIYIPYESNWKERGHFDDIEHYRNKSRSVRCSSIAEIKSWFEFLKGA